MKFVLMMSACLVCISTYGQSVETSRYLGRAKVYFQNSQIDSAAYYARQDISVTQQRQEWNRYAYVLGWLGDSYRREEQYDSAFHYLSRALVTVASNPVHDTTRAATHHQLGLYYKETRQPAQAIQMYEQALETRKLLGDSVALANTYNALATVYRYTYFDYLTAERYYQQALDLLASSSETKKRFDVLYNLATTNRLKGDLDKALAYGYRAASLAQELKVRDREVCFTMLGNILDDKNDVKLAIANLRQALTLGIQRLGNSDPALIRRFNNLAAVYISADSLSLGVQLLTHSLQIHRLNPYAPQEDDLADTYELLGDAYVRQEKLDSANHSYHQSLAIHQKVHGSRHFLTSQILSTIGEFHQQQQSYDSALYYFQQSLSAGVPGFTPSDIRQQPTVAMMRNNPLNFKLLYQKAIVFLGKYQQSSDQQWLSPALICFARADSLIDSCRVLYDREAPKLSFLEDNKKVYEAAVACAYALYQTSPEEQYLEWAFHFMEKSKAVVLWEALADSQIKSGVGIPDSLLEIERTINAALAYTNSELLNISDQTDSTVAKIADLRAQQFTLTRQREAFTQLLRRQYPRYFQIKYGNTHYTLAQARDYTNLVSTHLIEYLWGKEYVYALSVSPRGVALKQLSLTDTIHQSLSTVLRALQHPPYITQSRSDFHAYAEAAYTLHETLLRPLTDNEQRKSSTTSPGLFHSIQEAQQQVHAPTLTIIPDGPLSYLSFEALLTNRPSSPVPDYRHLEYLLDRYAVSYAQSAQVLTQRSQPTDESRSAMRFLAFGYASQPTPDTTIGHADLPGTAREIEALGQMAEGMYYLGAGATEHRFKSEAMLYDVIHLAVHGLADTLNPNNSRLVFRAGNDSIEDGLLHSYELYDLQLQADLAVLSSCESGTGRWQQGEGVYSLARGFTYAGCPTVVMSLWKVDDQQTSAIMPAFYRGLYQGHQVDQALRTAKIQYRQQCSHFFAHPAFWSAFVVEGNTFPIVSYQATYHAAWFIVLLSFIYLAMTVYRRWKVHRGGRQSLEKVIR